MLAIEISNNTCEYSCKTLPALQAISQQLLLTNTKIQKSVINIKH